MFIELLAPSLCSACMMFGGAQAGIDVGPVQIGAGWIDKHLDNGRMDDDTLLVSGSAALFHVKRFSAGASAALIFTPDGKGPHPKRYIGGPWAQLELGGGFAVRAYVMPGESTIKHPQGIVALRWETK